MKRIGKFLLALLFIFSIGLYRAVSSYNLLKHANRIATVAEVYDTWETADSNCWAYYFYLVGHDYYYGATTGNLNNLKDLKTNEIRKFPVLCNKNNPEKHMFLSDHMISNSYQIGDTLVDEYVPNSELFWEIFWTAAPTAEQNQKRLKEYLDIKSNISEEQKNNVW